MASAPSLSYGDSDSQYNSYKSKSDIESGPGSSSVSSYASLMDGQVRQGFIRKVYAILTVMLLVTFSTVALFSLSKGVQQYIQQHTAVLYSALGIYIGSALLLTCCGEGPRRTYPTNYILLSVFTAASSIMLGVVSASYAPEGVALAAGLTLFIFVGLTAFAWQTKIDFTPLNQGLGTVLWGLILFGLACAFFPGQAARNAYATLGAILFSFFIIVDTQMLVGGNREFVLGPDDYVLAALQLYREWAPLGSRQGHASLSLTPPHTRTLTCTLPNTRSLSLNCSGCGQPVPQAAAAVWQEE
jgi:FtsH-binding integral membrane protein